MAKNKIVIKRLTASDLTFFEWQFRNKNAGNQKAINLNRDVFIDELYPSLPEAAEANEGKFPLDLNIYGPDGKELLNLQRKIVKLGTYKNWRLNGEFVHNPESDNCRFNSLQPDDFAIFEFIGALSPRSANLFLISQNCKADLLIHKELDQILGTNKMARLTHENIMGIIEKAQLTDSHPVRSLTIEDMLEDAALGGAVGMDKLWKGVGRQRLTHEALQKARKNAEDVGRLGEELMESHFQEKVKDNEIISYEWTANTNAVAPYDFIINNNEQQIMVDIKTTSGEFERTIHISFNELRQMANDERRYDLYRVYNIEAQSAKLRIADNLKDYALCVLKAFEGLPNGTVPDSISVNPDTLNFGTELTINIPLKLDDE